MVGFGGGCHLSNVHEVVKAKKRKRVYRKVPSFGVWVPKQQIIPCEESIMHVCLIFNTFECTCH